MLHNIFPRELYIKELENGKRELLPNCPEELYEIIKANDDKYFSETGVHRYVNFDSKKQTTKGN